MGLTIALVLAALAAGDPNPGQLEYEYRVIRGLMCVDFASLKRVLNAFSEGVPWRIAMQEENARRGTYVCREGEHAGVHVIRKYLSDITIGHTVYRIHLVRIVDEFTDTPFGPARIPVSSMQMWLGAEPIRRLPIHLHIPR